MTLEIKRATAQFRDWDTLVKLLRAAFAYQDNRINPPSSVHALDVESVALKARKEQLFLAFDGTAVVGCVFARRQGNALYVGKLAVWPHRQREGIARRLMQATEHFAYENGLPTLELDTRIELNENHQAFEALGFTKTAEGAHEGFNRPTFITMRKRIARDA